MMKMQEWGLTNVKMEKWGPLPRGWAGTRFAAMMAVIADTEDTEKWRGKLKDKIVLTTPSHESALSEDPTDMRPKPEHAALSGYFNLDNGKVRGIYIQDND
jgi:hypothetical protein